ncbi:hypothetical protein H8D36_06740 [archaeon]|nr:hypothetical protein [archaeon]
MADLEQAKSFVWQLVVVGIFLAIGLIVLAQFMNTAYSDASGTVVGFELATETTDGAFVAFPNATLPIVACSVTNVTNQTEFSQIGDTNYTLSSDGCNIQATATSPYNNSLWNVSYTFTYGLANDASNAIGSTITATDDVADWLPILVVMLMAGIVVALVQILRRRS